MNIKNIFDDIPLKIEDEIFEDILETDDFIVERIISEGHASPPDFWYDQKINEFVVLLTGSAKVDFENEESVILKPGDYLIIPAHKKHRVDWTDPNIKTLWLTIHY
ncbi:MAG: cupin domain-containing protein [Melioribacteraceae bacterium]|nr:cupin domain-containing protein [Melioribacteraceae bacterium]